jgi:adenosylcobinamide-GDP ribazoletransferase
MREQIDIFWNTVQFYTRLPIPRWVKYHESYLSRGTCYFPVIGWIVACGQWAGMFAGSLVFSPGLSVVLGLLLGIWMTGAFHEDGLADVCDGFGGGWTTDQILTIMKDSRVGTYGLIGLSINLAIKALALYELSLQSSMMTLGWILLSAHSLSRASAIGFVFWIPYARADAESKAKPIAKQLSLWHLLLTYGIASLPLVAWSIDSGQYIQWAALLPVAILWGYLKKLFVKWIGGYTGDCLGATQQLAESLLYLCWLGMMD